MIEYKLDLNEFMSEHSIRLELSPGEFEDFIKKHQLAMIEFQTVKYYKITDYKKYCKDNFKPRLKNKTKPHTKRK